mmetsp:Transcript_59127/g.105523  ORF Transcript_59127/g.105523 Transcript_59127/m.105523 type:complete len:85 (+) Transcript_59127:369-623(+)
MVHSIKGRVVQSKENRGKVPKRQTGNGCNMGRTIWSSVAHLAMRLGCQPNWSALCPTCKQDSSGRQASKPCPNSPAQPQAPPKL